MVVGSFFLTSFAFSTHDIGIRARLVELGILLLAIGSDLLAGTLTRWQAARIFGVFVFLAGVMVAWLLFVGTPPGVGDTSGYVAQAATYVLYITVLAAYAVRYYQEDFFLRAFYNLGRIELVVALLAFAASNATHRVLMVDAGRGFFRLQGTLSEPSSWAAAIPPLLILAWRHRHWLWLVLALVAGIASLSPTVIIGTGVSLLIYCFLVGNSRVRKWYLALILVVVVPYGVSWQQHANYEQMLTSRNPAQATMGRVLRASHNISQDLQAGTTGVSANPRLSSGQVVINEIRGTPKFWTGWGLGASDKYFPAKYRLVEDHTLWLTALFDLGVIAAMVLVAVGVRALWRVRRRPSAAAFVPLIVYAFINSAGGWDAYQLPVIGIFLFGFGWEARGRSAVHDQRSLEGADRI